MSQKRRVLRIGVILMVASIAMVTIKAGQRRVPVEFRSSRMSSEMRTPYEEEGTMEAQPGMVRRGYSLFLAETPSGAEMTSTTKKRPALVFLHGFTRTRKNHRGLGRRLSVRFDMAVLLIDLAHLLLPSLLGSGERARDNCIREAIAFTKWIKSRPYVDADKVVIGGFSAGGAIAFEAAVQLQIFGLSPIALILLDAVPWPRTALAAPKLAHFTGGALLLETEPSLFNDNCAFSREVLPKLQPDCSLAVVRVPGTIHVDAEGAGAVSTAVEGNSSWLDGCRPSDGCIGNRLWGEARVEKAAIFQRLIEAFLEDALKVGSMFHQWRGRSSLHSAANDLGLQMAHSL